MISWKSSFPEFVFESSLYFISLLSFLTLRMKSTRKRIPALMARAPRERPAGVSLDWLREEW